MTIAWRRSIRSSSKRTLTGMRLTPLQLSLLVAGPLSLANMANAQGRLEEIIVSAQRFEESLQDVPIAVTALSAEDLENTGISGIEGLTGGVVPSIQVQQFAGRPGEMQISIRGVGGSDPAQVSFEQAVAIYNDGAYYARGGLGLGVLELERLEVLRGPQGTLFGRNALGGAVNMIPRKPGGEFRLKQTVEYGRFDTLLAHTTLETKEWNDLALKLDYRKSETDGWQSNPWQGPVEGRNDFAEDEQDAYRAAIRWTPTDAFVADYAFDRTDLEYVQTLNHLIINSDTPLAFFLAPFAVDKRQRQTAATPPGLYAPLSKQSIKGHSLNLEWSINDTLKFRSITAYREFTLDTNALNGWGIASPAVVPGVLTGGQNSIEDTDQDQFSQEFLLSGNIDRLRYTVGAIYFTEDASNTTKSRFTVTTPFSGPNWTPLSTPIETPPTTTGVELESFGIFGQVVWTPPIMNDRLDLTAGLRYSNDKKDLLRTQLLGQPVHLPIKNDVERVDPSFTANFKLTEDTSTYITWSTGYRGGGASVRELPAPTLDPNDTGFNPFDEEKVEATELGLKSDFWDGRARFNTALFYQEYKDKQVSFQKDAVANTRVFNIDKVVILKGAEVEFSVLPLDNLTLNASATYLNNNINSVFNPTSRTEEAFRMALMPKWAWSASANYALPVQALGGDINLFVNVTGSTDYCFNERSCIGRFTQLRGGSGETAGEDNTLVSARLTLTMAEVANGTLKLGLWGENLLDQKYYQFGFSVPGLNTGTINFGDPRTYGVFASFEFGGK